MSELAASAVLDGWFTLDADAPQLLGARCKGCGTVYFPALKTAFCRNPDCGSEQFEAVPLSRHGRLWSYTNAAYQPPEPYAQVPAAEFKPFAIAAVELEAEKMIVLGQVVAEVGVDQLQVGMAMELALEPLADGKLTWKWKPASMVAIDSTDTPRPRQMAAAGSTETPRPRQLAAGGSSDTPLPFTGEGGTTGGAGGGERADGGQRADGGERADGGATAGDQDGPTP